MLETSIDKLHQSYYIMDTQKLACRLPHVRIIGTHPCGKTRRDAFKFLSKFQYVSCRRDYNEHVVAIFANQIQSEYYDGNIYVSIEGNRLDSFSPIDT